MPAFVLGKNPQNRVQDITGIPGVSTISPRVIYRKQMNQTVPVFIR
ncbi:hypothetical protein SAMN04487926_118143 [Paraburkholderia steynii]|uniref:Uncharacterized protein n=1 Tax=Paraburkholderia steynii TaxID=1245441 RepID=A0A7Z7BBD7_9BURK|nr:hypothetical protein SAMN04487926_118143 [Paraburkholderia steynii]